VLLRLASMIEDSHGEYPVEKRERRMIEVL
jgi:hypothetical protein